MPFYNIPGTGPFQRPAAAPQQPAMPVINIHNYPNGNFRPQIANNGIPPAPNNINRPGFGNPGMRPPMPQMAMPPRPAMPAGPTLPAAAPMAAPPAFTGQLPPAAAAAAPPGLAGRPVVPPAAPVAAPVPPPMPQMSPQATQTLLGLANLGGPNGVPNRLRSVLGM